MNTLGILGLTIAVALGVCANARAAGPTTLPTHQIFAELTSPDHVTVRWRHYTVRIYGGSLDDGTVAIGDKDQPILRQVRGEVLTVSTTSLQHSAAPDLIIQMSNGTNISGCLTTYVFTQNSGLREMASITGGGDFEQLGSRILYVMDHTGLLELAGDYCHACSPSMPLVFDWNGGHPVNRTARYSWLSRYYDRTYRLSLQTDIRRVASLEDMGPIYSDAAGYYGNECELGHGKAAYRWIMRRLPSKAMRADFELCAYNIRRRMAQLPVMVSHSDAKVVHSPEDSVFSVDVLSLPARASS